MASSDIGTILRAVQESLEPVRVHGASRSSQAYVLSKWAIGCPDPIVCICPRDDWAEEMAEDVSALSRSLLAHPVRTAVLPTWEHSPFSSIHPSIRTRLARVATLAAVQADSPPDIIFLSVQALVQATIPPPTLRRFTLSLETGSSVGSREKLVRQLQEAGYLAMDPVEDPGSFATRGDLIDIFPPGFTSPIRIDLFGDEIEKIRHFDPSTQLTARDSTLSRVRLPPAREVLINHETHGPLRKAIKEYADDRAVHRRVRDPVLEAIRDGHYPDHSDTWAPFAYPVATFLDFVPEKWPLVWSDELACRQELDEQSTKHSEFAEEALANHAILPPLKDLFLIEKDPVILRRPRLFFDQIELASLEKIDSIEEKHLTQAKQHVNIRTNADLTLDSAAETFQLWIQNKYTAAVFASTQSQIERIRHMMDTRGIELSTGAPTPGRISCLIGDLSEGFRWPAESIALVTEAELLKTPRKKKNRRTSRTKTPAGLESLSDLAVGDFVVHIDHGIGTYRGIKRLTLSGAPSDFLQLEYANRDRLYLPVYRLNLIQKYSGGHDRVKLDRLGQNQFEKTKEKVKESIKKLAFDLVQLYAERKLHKGTAFSQDSLFEEFEAKFPFDETEDQLKSIRDSIADLESGKIMDRLICGDVGFGKTEVAMRAAFLAVTSGTQVAILVPTTILAHQHEESFQQRLKDYPVKVASLSRFKKKREQAVVLEAIKSGSVDIVIGTHRLLSKDVRFKKLGLVIIDEEHRFGVEHKEKLKTMKLNTHVMTLTATPIPRTLHMAMSGLRDISIMSTPPVDRLPIRTYISKYDQSLIARAVEFELKRGGQVFFLHNRVDSISKQAEKLEELLPNVPIQVAHGQMGERDLERAMLRFYRGEAKVLLCTTIIEAGLDIPLANTIFINKADRFGLAQLYQLRGRVGRSEQRAYCYLLVDSPTTLTDDARRRLEVIQRFVELGSGFSVASHDLEIRGGGNLLGPEQSGQIAAVGLELYTDLLEEAIAEIQGLPRPLEESRREPEIKAPFPAFVDEDFVPDVHQRLSLYRRLSASENDEELRRLEEEMQDRYGPLPEEAQNLLWVLRVKHLLRKLGVDVLTVGQGKVALTPGEDSRFDPSKAVTLVASDPSQFQLTPDSRLVIHLPTNSLKELYFRLEPIFDRLT